MKLLLISCAAVTAFAQTKTLNCEQAQHGEKSQVTVCEMREQTVAYSGKLSVDGGVNGGVSVKSWDGSNVLVRSKVQGMGPDEGAARSALSQVRVDVSAGQLRATGPENIDNRWWSVSYEIFVPRNADLSVKTHNGAVSLADVRGNIDFTVNNGSVTLKNLAGDVQGTTKNGSLNIELTGNRWDGTKLDARTTNGGINVKMPQNYSAHLETATVNGHFNADIPMTVHGNISKKVSADIGSGGPTIHVETTNGGVNVRKI